VTTLSAVAKHAGVGIGTVSRVINDQPNVSIEMRARVMESIAAVGYQMPRRRKPDPSTRAAYIGVLTVFFDEPSVYERCKGLIGYLQPLGYEVVIYNAVAPQQIRERVEAMASHPLEGAVVISAQLDDEETRILRNAPFPVVMLDTFRDGFRSVGIDDRFGGEIAARHLLDMGHRRIGFVGEPVDQFGFTASSLREQGFRDAHKKAGVKVDEQLIRHGAHIRSAAKQLAMDLLSMKNPVTAIVATSDVQAIGVMEAASDLGVKVPEQLSVIGYDDLEIASLLGITTVRQQLELSGQRGAAHVIEAINGDGSHGAQEKIDVEVIVRNTTRPPK
jgi:DNA-binding LacI/PurR family transcriptional regulator